MAVNSTIFWRQFHYRISGLPVYVMPINQQYVLINLIINKANILFIKGRTDVVVEEEEKEDSYLIIKEKYL